LRRLEAKGYLRSRRQGRAKVYLARIRPEQVRREVVDDFVDRLFDGEAIPLFQHFIEDRGLSGEEIGQLRAMLDRLEENER
jgi:predicted transcriptional regulator